jgi:uroporphyrinogen-III synthase
LKLVLTRPEAEAPAWVQGLVEVGHQVQCLPLLAFGPAPNPQPLSDAWHAAHSYHAAMFVSSQAVRSFFAVRPNHLDWPSRCWATGPGTRAALLQAGVQAGQIDMPDANAAQLDSEALWAAVSQQVMAPKGRSTASVLLVRGSDALAAPQEAGHGRDWLAQQLLAAGAQVTYVVAYQRLAPPWTDTDKDQAAQAATNGAVWLFSSSQAWVQLQRLMPQQNWSQARALATHPRIAAALASQGAWGKVVTCKGDLAAVRLALAQPAHWA